MSPFLPVNTRLLNEDSYDNPETIDTSLSGKDDMSHTGKNDFTGGGWQKNTNNDEEYKEETSKIKEGNESVDNSESSDNLLDDSIIKKTQKREALIQRLITMNFKYHVIHSLINIVPLSGGEMI